MPPRNASRPAPADPTLTAVAPNWLRFVILALAVLLLLTRFTPEFRDSDSWWHLATGKFVVEQHRLPVPDPFAWTTYIGQPAYPEEPQVRYFNLTHEWLAQAIFYLAYAVGSFGGVVLLRGAVLVAMSAVVGWIAWRRTRGFFRAVMAGLLAASIAERFTSDRPFLFTFLLLAVTIAILDQRRWLWALVPLFLVWANLHGGYFLGWAALGAYAAEAFLRKEPWAEQRRLWLAGGAAVLACGLNPNGFRAVLMPLTYNKSFLQTTLLEWQHTSLWPLEMFGVVLAGALAALLWARGAARIADWLLFSMFAFAAIWAVRNVMLIGIVGPVLIATHFPWKRALPVAAQFAAGLALAVAAGYTVASGEAFQMGAAEWAYPKGASDFLLHNRISGRLLNSYSFGGYLDWKFGTSRRVFLDGRALNENVFLDYRRMVGNADSTGGKSSEELLDQYGIDIILMEAFEAASGAVFLLPAALSDPSQKEWQLVYQDGRAVIFMRHPPPGLPVLDSRLALVSMEAQCTTHLEHDPGHPGCARSVAELFSRIGDRVRASRWNAVAVRYE
jgi:hypothetical protein